MTFYCEFCTYTADYKSHMTRHVDAVHLKLRGFRCNLCGHSCSSKTLLKQHTKSVHDKIRDFQCELCTSAFSTRGDLMKHRKMVHDKIKDKRCNLCNASFSTNTLLRRHVSSVHSRIRNFRCTACNTAFTCKSHLERHLQYNCSGGDTCSAGEKKIMEILDKYRIEYIYDGNHNGLRSFDNRGYLRFDFIVKVEGQPNFIFIEFDGIQHYLPQTFGGGCKLRAELAFHRLKKNDAIKDSYCRKHGYPLLRVKYDTADVEAILREFLTRSGAYFWVTEAS